MSKFLLLASSVLSLRIFETWRQDVVRHTSGTRAHIHLLRGYSLAATGRVLVKVEDNLLAVVRAACPIVVALGLCDARLVAIYLNVVISAQIVLINWPA